jgi:hypothetical protein
MRRSITVALVVAGLAALTIVLVRRVDSPREEPRRAADSRPSDATPAPLAPVGERGAQRSWSAALAGRVVDSSGRAVPGASVRAQGPLAATAAASREGTFELRSLPPGAYTLFAREGLRSSAPLGPVPLGAGEELRELVLVLETGAALSGAVLDARDGAPIANAVVAAAAASAHTDLRGRYRLTGLPGGSLAVSATAEGYLSRSSQVELSLGRERTGADIHLERGARVHGTVRASGAPVAGARILAARYGFAARLSQITPVAVSDAAGAFAGTAPPGRVELLGQAAGYAEARTEELELAPDEDREANLELGPGGSVFGQVRDAAGAGAAGCRLSAFDSVHGRETGAAASGPGGQYFLASLPQAVYAIAATCSQGRAEASGVKVAEGEQVQVDLTLGTGAIAGRVVDAARSPVPGAAVIVREEGSPAPGEPLASSRSDGTFEVRGLSGNLFALQAATPEGTSPERGSVAPGTRDLELVIGSGALEGRVVGDRSEPVPDFTVYAESSELGGGRTRSQRFLSPSGDFRMVLSPGRYGLRVGAPGYAPGAVPAVEVKAQGGRSVKVVLARGATIRGRALDPHGAPIASARVATSSNLLWAFGRAAPVPNGAATTTDESGAFALTGVAGGATRLFAQKEGFVQRGHTAVEVPSGGDASADVVLQPNPSAEPAPEFAGVGMVLGARDGAVVVQDVFEGGPAREAGLRPGDLIVQVNAVPTAGVSLEDVTGRIRGLVGTPVSMVVRRDGRDFLLSISRASVKF